MSEYLIAKREPCPFPDCWVRQDIESGAPVLRNNQPGHQWCSGYTETRVNLLDVLGRLRWQKIGYGGNNLDNFIGLVIDEEFLKPRIDEGT
jgi:hypothetical protein